MNKTNKPWAHAYGLRPLTNPALADSADHPRFQESTEMPSREGDGLSFASLWVRYGSFHSTVRGTEYGPHRGFLISRLQNRTPVIVILAISWKTCHMCIDIKMYMYMHAYMHLHMCTIICIYMHRHIYIYI